MGFDSEDLRMQKEWFRMKLASERQIVDVVRGVRDPVKKGDFILLDTRPRADYEKGHIPGAWSLPLEETTALATALPKARELVTYCWNAT